MSARSEQFGLGANVPEDANYPLNLGDESGKPLDGTSNYTLHFEKAALPPVNAFWSVTLYDLDSYQVAKSFEPVCAHQLDAAEVQRRWVA